jgi:hypothetical protein
LVAEIAASANCVARRVGCTRPYRICGAVIKVARILRSLEAQPKAYSHLKFTVIITISRESFKGENANEIAGIAKAGVAIAN